MKGIGFSSRRTANSGIRKPSPGSRSTPSPAQNDTVCACAAGGSGGVGLFGDVVDAEGFVRDEQHCRVSFRAGAVFHHFTFGKPDERSWSKGSIVGDELSFQDIDAMP